jgi:hypothetical protein
MKRVKPSYLKSSKRKEQEGILEEEEEEKSVARGVFMFFIS